MRAIASHSSAGGMPAGVLHFFLPTTVLTQIIKSIEIKIIFILHRDAP